MRLVSSHEMQEMDRLAIEEVGIPGPVLMENAARGAARVFMEHFDPDEGCSVHLLHFMGANQPHDPAPEPRWPRHTLFRPKGSDAYG